jgi:Histidine kinase-, DNA gyrase B-, and HSP90-like ATPase
MTELLSNVLDYSRIDSKGLRPIIEKIDFKLLIRSVISSNEAEIRELGKDIKIELKGKFPNSIESDRSALTRVLMILLNNAVRRSPRGKKITIKPSHNNNMLELGIKDEGPPLSSLQRACLLNNSTSSPEGTSTPLEYINLELSSAKKIIEKLSGNLEYLDSEKNQSFFLIRIPCKNTESRSIQNLPSTLKSRSFIKRRKAEKGSTFNSISLLSERDLVSKNSLEKAIQELKSLVSIPIFKGGTLINRIRQIKKIWEQSEHHCLPAFKNLEMAVYEGNANKFKNIIQTIVEQSTR